MTPRAEFVLLAALAGALVSVLGLLAMSGIEFGSGTGGMLRTALLWSPAGALAALGGAWMASGWHRRALRRGRRWRAAGLALRTTVLALLMYPLVATGWVLLTAWLDHRFAAAGLPLHEIFQWLPSIVLAATVLALVAGGLPALVIVFLLGRRYLRRLADPSTETA